MSANAETMTGALREEDAPLFVINLCASTTPVALTQPSSPELKRYTFFVTRRREEGRERFRLHMGYFSSIDEAEALLADIREVYPAAWAGPAPGNNKPSPRIAAVAKPPKAAEIPAAVAAVVHAAAPATPAAPVAPVTPAAVTPEAPLELTLVEDQPRHPVQQSTDGNLLGGMSNVREVLAALDDSPGPWPSPPVLQPLAPKPVAARPAAVVKPAAAPKVDATKSVAPPALTPKQELSLLQTGDPLPDLDDSAIRMMTPEDTQTLRDIKLDTENQAPPSFAVQLMWSVTPIDMGALTQLAIFDAYTLYHVEGSRQGRRWYGVRLGFFTDVNAAKQVAYFMKADYSSVVVVPVTVKERSRATGEGEGEPGTARPAAVKPAAVKAAAAKPAVAKVSTPALQAGSDGFELLPTDKALKTQAAAVSATAATTQTRLLDAAVDLGPVGKTPAAPARKPQGGKKPTGKRVVARGRRAEPGQPAPLEETLELLGASTLTLDEDKKTIIDDSALRRSADASKKKPGGLRFSKLLGRLSEKLGDTRR